MRRIIPVREPIDATVRPPGSKSQTIRALFAAGLASGTSTLHHPLDSDDTGFAREALRRLGVEIVDDGDHWTVIGSSGSLGNSGQFLDAGASGLTARCLIAAAAMVEGTTTVIGRDRLPERPMWGLVAALNDLGVGARATGGRLPVTVEGTGRLPGGSVEVDSHETTQFLTGLLMAGPLAGDPLTITPIGIEGSAGYVDLTLQSMEAFGARVERVG
ncbi:MAG: 3-phosphoshikimate 1-carboxyvinyltransferase, partial [Acidimicrobiia bacterium]